MATIVSHGLDLRDNHSIVMSDFYGEQAGNGVRFEGATYDPPERATITKATCHSFTADDPAKNHVLDDLRHLAEADLQLIHPAPLR